MSLFKSNPCEKFINGHPIVALILITFILTCVLLSFCFIAFNIIKKNNTKSYENGYIDACKDFYKGKLKYDLIENPDGTKTWQKIIKK